jgi:Tol biopolymer transport system component
LGAWVSEPTISPDGETVAFFSDRAKGFFYDLYVMKLDGTQLKPLGVTAISKHNRNAVFLTDGNRILFLAGTEWRWGRPISSLWQVDADGKNPRRIADSGLFTDPQHWKPKL